MAVPVLESIQSSTSSGSSVSSLSMAVSSGIEAGDLVLIAIMSSSSSVTASIDDTTYPGWTLSNQVGGATSGCYSALFWKKAGASESAVTVDLSGASYVCGFYVRVSGANANNPIHAAVTEEELVSTFYHYPDPVTTTKTDCLIIVSSAHDGGDPANIFINTVIFKEWKSHSVYSGTGSSNCCGILGYANLAAGGTSEAVTIITGNQGDSMAHITSAISPSLRRILIT